MNRLNLRVHPVSSIWRRGIFTCVMLTLVACATATPTAPPRAVEPTLSAPEYREAAAPITVLNAAAITYLGRLDQPDVLATVFAYAVSPDGLNLVGLTDQEIINWDLLTGTRVFTTARVDAVRAMFASDKETIYLLDSTGTVRSIDATTSQDLFNAQGHNDFAGIAAFAPEVDLMALGGRDGTIKIWDMVTRESRVTIPAASAPITALIFTPDATRVISADDSGWRRVWDSTTGVLIAEQRNEILGANPLITTALAVSNDGSLVAAANDNGALIWNTTDQTTRSLVDGNGGRPTLIELSPNGRWLITGMPESGLTLWDTTNQQPIGRLPETSGDRIDADFSPDGDLLLTSALNGSVRLWDVSNPRENGGRASDLDVGSSTIFAVEWTDDGRALIIFDANGAIYVWGIA